MRGGACGNNLEVEVDCAVVLTVIWELAAPGLGVTDEGVGTHDTPCGNLLLGQLRATGWLKPLIGETVMV